VNPLAPFSDKLHKLFKLLLSSTSPGEIVNARDAMLRVVTSNSGDLHSLAEVLVAGLKPEIKTVYRDRAPNKEAHARDVAAWCLEQFEAGALCYGEKERTFVEDMARRYGDPTEKQRAWLAKIFDRLIIHQRNRGAA
jgi:hypothetical protein